MTPQTVNAVNLPAMNAMNFPAAILQPPFFDPKRPLAMDYGAIGAIIGHEVSHSFDNQGALFDAQGRLHNWWTPEDFKHFEGSATALVKQYDAYKPFPTLRSRDSRRSAKTSPTWRACPRPTTPTISRWPGSRRRWSRGSPETSSSSSASRRAALEVTGAEPAESDPDRRARARRVSRLHRSEPRSLVQGIRVKPGRRCTSRRRPCASLVIGNRASARVPM